jgi:hypothetical protein
MLNSTPSILLIFLQLPLLGPMALEERRDLVVVTCAVQFGEQVVGA